MGLIIELHGNKLLDVFGLKRVKLTFANEEKKRSIDIMSLDVMKFTLGIAHSKGFITADEVPSNFALATSFGLLPTWDDVSSCILKFRLPAGHSPKITFKMCACNWPLPHGDIVLVDDETSGYGGTVNAATDGMKYCMEMAEMPEFSPFDLADVLRQVLEAKLPVTQSEFTRLAGSISTGPDTKQ